MWLLDSLYEPQLLTDETYRSLLERFPATYAVVSVLPATAPAVVDVAMSSGAVPRSSEGAVASSSSSRAAQEAVPAVGPRIVTGFGVERVEDVATHERVSLRNAVNQARQRREEGSRGRVRDFHDNDLDRSRGGPWQLGK